MEDTTWGSKVNSTGSCGIDRKMYLAGVNELQEQLKTQTDSHLQLGVATGGHTPLLE